CYFYVGQTYFMHFRNDLVSVTQRISCTDIPLNKQHGETVLFAVCCYVSPIANRYFKTVLLRPCTRIEITGTVLELNYIRFSCLKTFRHQSLFSISITDINYEKKYFKSIKKRLPESGIFKRRNVINFERLRDL